MVETVIYLLIQIALVALLIYLAIWALERIGIALPPMVVQILWVIAVLIVILLLWRAIGSSVPRLKW